jgi:hypothetical protein
MGYFCPNCGWERSESERGDCPKCRSNWSPEKMTLKEADDLYFGPEPPPRFEQWEWP